MQNYLSLLFLVFIWSVAYWMIRKGRKGESVHLRHLAIFEKIKEAVGRATEMGRPIMFTSGHSGGGLNSKNSAAHLAGLSMLGYVAEECAKNDVPLYFVPGFSPMVPVGENIMREAAIAAGAPEWFKTDMIRFFSDNNYVWALGCVSVIREEKTAANFMIGAFWSSDALIIGGAGQMEGCINVAGEVQVSGCAGFIPTCDYVMMGEEVMASSAYVSRDIPMLNSIISGDYAKALWTLLVLIGVILTSLGINIDWFTL